MFKPEGTLEDIMVSIDSWEYPIDFLVINPRSRLDGHPLILGRPWLATSDAYICCRDGNMSIERGSVIKNLILYPPAKPSPPIVNLQLHSPKYQEENLRSPLSLYEALGLKNKLEEDVINSFINKPVFIGDSTCQMLKYLLDNDAQGDPLENLNDNNITTIIVHNRFPIDIEIGKTLNINDGLEK